MQQNYPSLVFTKMVAKALEDRGVTLDDILKLHRLGFLDVLPDAAIPAAMTDFRLELDRAFPEKIPSSVQIGCHHLALRLINNSPDALETFTARRKYYAPLDDPENIRTSVEYRELMQCAYPQSQFNPSEFEPKPRPCPRLIDRMQPIRPVDAQECLRSLKYLSKGQYEIIYQRCFNHLSYKDIAAARGCESSTLPRAYRKTITKLRSRKIFVDRLLTTVFGPGKIGRVCETT